MRKKGDEMPDLKMANKPEEFPIFTPLDNETVQNMLVKISNYLCNISDIIKIDHKKIDTAIDIMYEIIERIEKRRVFFMFIIMDVKWVS
jgi:hypothetical protein